MKYNVEIARKELLKFGYYLDTEDYVNSRTKMPCHDKDGFKYVISMNDCRTKRHPYKYVKSNPFTIENIQMVLDLETDGTSILEDHYTNKTKKMMFKCSCGEIFHMSLNAFNSGKRYCNFCSKSKRYDGLIDYTSIIKEMCIKKDYTLLTEKITRSSQEFEYVCNKHRDKGTQKSSYDRLINMGRGCKYCGIVSRGIKHRIDVNDAIELCEEKGFEFVDYEYIRRYNSSRKIQIKCICRNHTDKGVQLIDYQNMKTNKVGCVYCKGLGRTKESFQKELDNNSREIKIVEFVSYADLKVQCCICGYIWDTNGANLTSGHGCPKCSKSRYEKYIEDILLKNKIDYVPQFTFEDCKDINALPFDFYIINSKTLIEVDGQGHYYPVNFRGISDEEAMNTFNNTVFHDVIKNEYCKSKGINLLRIPYYLIDDKDINIEKYILSNI